MGGMSKLPYESATSNGLVGWGLFVCLLLHDARQVVVARPLHLLLGDTLLDVVVCVSDGCWHTAYGDDTVTRARREGALLADLDAGSRQLLDLYQVAPPGTCSHTHSC